MPVTIQDERLQITRPDADVLLIEKDYQTANVFFGTRTVRRSRDI
jgi:hypothetical protein